MGLKHLRSCSLLTRVGRNCNLKKTHMSRSGNRNIWHMHRKESEFLSLEHHQNSIILRPIVAFNTDIGVHCFNVKIKICVLCYLTLVNLCIDFYTYIQTDTPYSVSSAVQHMTEQDTM